MIRSPATVLAPTVVLLALVGCSPATQTAGPSGPPASTTGQASPSPTLPTVVPVDGTGLPHPCRLVTKQEADATIGTEFPEGEIINNENEQYFGVGRRCQYHPPQVYSGPKVDVRIGHRPSNAVWTAFMHDIGKILGGAELVPGLGDKAYLFRRDHDCFVFQGRFLLDINLLWGFMTPPDANERLIALCRTAVARIPAS